MVFFVDRFLGFERRGGARLEDERLRRVHDEVEERRYGGRRREGEAEEERARRREEERHYEAGDRRGGDLNESSASQQGYNAYNGSDYGRDDRGGSGDGGATLSRVPISLEDLKRRKAQEEEAKSKPVFLSKAERRARALEERKAQVEAMKRSYEANVDGPREGSHYSSSSSAIGRGDNTGDGGFYSSRGEGGFHSSRGEGGFHSSRGEGASSSRHSDPPSSSSRHSDPPSSSSSHPQSYSSYYGDAYDDESRRREVERIRKEKLGVITLSQRKAAQGASFRVLSKDSHWDNSEDTSKDSYDSLWLSQASSIQPQFGRTGGHFSSSIDPHDGGDDDPRDKHAPSNQSRRHRNQHNQSINHHSSSSSSSHSGSSSFSWAKKTLSEMTYRDWRIMREDFEISVKGKGDIPNPMRYWSESSLPDWALKAIADAGYTEPTAIQRQAIPIGLEGRDLIGLAETGSGKTASFLLPLLVHIVKMKDEMKRSKVDRNNAAGVNRNGSAASSFTPNNSNAAINNSNTAISNDDDDDEARGPYAAILAPTRELAMQIKTEADKFSQYADCKTVLLIGGEDQSGQISALRQGADIIVATTGRLVDLLQNAWISLSQCRYVVLDEGDRMIDLGFEEQLHFILDSMPSDHQPSNTSHPNASHNSSHTPSFNGRSSSTHHTSSAAASSRQSSSRTTILFSATMPPPVEKIAIKYLRNPITINVGDVGKAVERIRQNIEFTKSDAEKRKRLGSLLQFGPKPPIIIFLNHKASCDQIGKFVEKLGFRVSVLHSGKSQEARELAISQFKSFQTDVLVATNVAGRGLDVKGVTHVINFDLPDSIEEYTHRIGRTGRAGLEGTATSFLTASDDKILAPLKALLQKTNQKIPKELSDMLAHSSLRPVF